VTFCNSGRNLPRDAKARTLAFAHAILKTGEPTAALPSRTENKSFMLTASEMAVTD
jgi:hypothetical protein